MSKIIVSCDTTVALSKEQFIQYGIEVIPLNAIANSVEYHDTVDINSLQLCKLMRDGAKISTSTPTIQEIEDYFDGVFSSTQADHIIHFTISSKLSSMYSLFTTVCQEKYGDKVTVIDSLSVCEFMANQVIYAKKLVDEGKDVSEVVSAIEAIKNTENAIFIPESIEYLKRGGRVSPSVARIANILRIIPVLTFNNGEVGKKGITKTVKRAILNACEEWKKIPNFQQEYRLIILDADSSKVDSTRLLLVEQFGEEMCKSIVVCNISLNVTAHAGPGTIGIGYAKKVY